MHYEKGAQVTGLGGTQWGMGDGRGPVAGDHGAFRVEGALESLDPASLSSWW